MVCVSFRAYGPRWSIMAYDVRLSTETEVSLQKCNYIQIMAFPVVVIDKTDAGKKWLVEYWMIYAWGRHKNEASGPELSVSLAALSFPAHFSAVSIGCHPKPMVNPSRGSAQQPSESQATQQLPDLHLSLQPCTAFPLHKPWGPFRGQPSGLSSACVIIPIIFLFL